MSVSGKAESHFIETPRGLFTSAGNWFHVTSEALERYAPGLLAKHSLEKMVRMSEVWIRSADNIGIVLFMLLLYFQGFQTALLLTFFFVPIWHINKSSVVSIPLTGILTVVDKEVVVVLVSLAVLSWMGIKEEYLSLFVGFAVFCILKFGWLRFFVEWLYGFTVRGTILLNDRVLKMIILKYSLKEDIPVTEISDMENEMLSMIRKQKEVIEKYRKKRR